MPKHTESTDEQAIVETPAVETPAVETPAVETPAVEMIPASRAATFAQFYGVSGAWENWKTRTDAEIAMLLESNPISRGF